MTLIPQQRGVRRAKTPRRHIEPIHEAVTSALTSCARLSGIDIRPEQVNTLASAITPIVLRVPYVQRAQADEPVDKSEIELRPREQQAVMGLARGLTARQIGYRLGLTEDTIKSHLRSAYRTLGARNGAHAVAICLKYGLVKQEEIADV